MNVPWRRRKLSSLRVEEQGLGLGFPNDDNLLLEMEVIVPCHFLCPISLDLMKDPVILSSGITYDRESIEKWVEGGNLTCPVSNQALSSFDQTPNHSLRRMIQWWCVENKCHGIERIPTPCASVMPHEVAGACKRMSVAARVGDTRRCMQLVVKMKSWAKDSERNKKCIVENGAGCALSSAFESFSKGSDDENIALLEEILSVLVWAFPVGVEGQAKLGSVASLRRMVSMLKSGDLSVRRNVALILKKLVSSSQVHANALLGVEGIVQELFRLVKVPICPPSCKASLVTISYLVPSSERALSSLVDMGLVSLLVELIVDDGDKSMSEKALLVLDRLFDSRKGREEAPKNDLIVPVLFAKISLVPDLVSELCVSILWKLTKDDDKGGEGVVVTEALQLGERANPFQKLLMLLQVGCGESTKHKVKELLKLLNLHRDKMEYCVGSSSMDFRFIKRHY